MAAVTALSFQKSNDSLPKLDKNSLSWESFLPNHAIFKTLEKREKTPKKDAYLYKNILAEMHGDLLLWDNERKQIFVANLRNLKAKNERSSKLQVIYA